MLGVRATPSRESSREQPSACSLWATAGSRCWPPGGHAPREKASTRSARGVSSASTLETPRASRFETPEADRPFGPLQRGFPLASAFLGREISLPTGKTSWSFGPCSRGLPYFLCSVRFPCPSAQKNPCPSGISTEDSLGSSLSFCPLALGLRPFFPRRFP